jgi:hypothetical protein
VGIFHKTTDGGRDGHIIHVIPSVGTVPISGESPFPVSAPPSTTPTATFARPTNTTPYSTGQLVANSTAAGSVAPLTLPVARFTGGTGQLWRCRVRKSTASLTNAVFRVHIFSGPAAPTVANGDGGVFLPNNVANYIGAFNVTLDCAFSDGAIGIGTPSFGGAVVFATDPSTQNLWALIEARGAYTPGNAEVFGVTLEAVRD